MRVYRFYILIIAILCFPFFVNAQQTFVQKDMGDDRRQGLKFINDQAVEFVNHYNQEHQTHWKSLEPNAKILLSKCVLPMTSEWSNRFVDGYKPKIGLERIYVLVKCEKDVNGKSWKVEIPTTIPNRIIIQK